MEHLVSSFSIWKFIFCMKKFQLWFSIPSIDKIKESNIEKVSIEVLWIQFKMIRWILFKFLFNQVSNQKNRPNKKKYCTCSAWLLTSNVISKAKLFIYKYFLNIMKYTNLKLKSNNHAVMSKSNKSTINFWKVKIFVPLCRIEPYSNYRLKIGSVF